MFSVSGALRAKYNGQDWAFLQEVPNGTGGHFRRRADAIAMNLWPSRGLEIHGIEIKISRADWLKELDNPQKAETIYSYCDRWYLAVSDKSIVQDGELPPTWGLYVPHGDSLREKVVAPRLTPTKQLSKPFLAALLRCASQQLAPKDLTPEERSKEYQRGYSDGQTLKQSEADNWKSQHDKILKIHEEFQRISGTHVSHYNVEEIAKAAKLISEIGSRENLIRRLESDMVSHQSVARHIEEALKALKEIQ